MASFQANKWNIMHSDKLWGPRRVSVGKTSRGHSSHSFEKNPLTALRVKKMKHDVPFKQPEGKMQKCWLNKILKSKWLLTVIIACMCVYSPLSFIILFHMHHLFETSWQFYAAGKVRGSTPFHREGFGEAERLSPASMPQFKPRLLIPNPLHFPYLDSKSKPCYVPFTLFFFNHTI